MKNTKAVLFVFNILALVIMMSCDKDDVKIIDTDNLLIGAWVDPVYDTDVTTFKRANSLQNDGYGVQFVENGNFIERSSGWCGTPPLVFSDYNGEWLLDNSLISLTQDYYPINYAWRIVSLTTDTLVVKRELTEQEKEHRSLIDLINEIYRLSSNGSCLDSDNWAFTAYGAKACGGPQGFIAYSKNIDVEAFLEKVKAYTEAEKAFNIKWGVVSTCDVPQQPKSVSCQNGYPIFNY